MAEKTSGLQIFKIMNLISKNILRTHLQYITFRNYVINQLYLNKINFLKEIMYCSTVNLYVLFVCFCFLLFLATWHGLWDLSSLTRDWTWATAVKAPSPNHWTARELPQLYVNYKQNVTSFLKIEKKQIEKNRSSNIFLLYPLITLCLYLLWMNCDEKMRKEGMGKGQSTQRATETTTVNPRTT